MSKNFKFITGVLSLVLCFAAMAFGQRTSGNIEGTITDPNGAVVPNATVTAKATGTTTGFSQTVTTDENGYFQFSQVPSGTYEVTATGSGFKTSRQDVTVTLDRSVNASARLEVGGAGETVTVTADSAVTIDMGDTKIDTSITKRVIEDLPAGTTFSTLLKTAPNVRPEARGGGFQIDGASGSENTFIIDGQEVTNFRTGVLNSNFDLPFELIQEVQIKSTGYEAEYGGATGGVVNVVTVGGNDQWHGNFGVSFAPARFKGSARTSLTAFNVAGPPSSPGGPPTSVSNLPGNFIQFQPNKDGGTDFFPVAQFSGPIIKEKLWFSAIYAPQLFETHRLIDYYANTIPGNSIANPNGRILSPTFGSVQYHQRLKQEHAFFRLDAQPFSRLRLMGTFLWNPLAQEGILPANTEGLTGSPQSADYGGAIGFRRGAAFLDNQGGRRNANAVNGQATWNPTNYLILNFRAGRSFLNEKLNSYNIPRSTRYICSAVSGGATSATAGCQTGFQNFANNAQINFDVSTRTTFDADASLVGINALGRHNFKFGYQLNRLFNTVDSGYVPFGIIQLFYDRGIDALGTPITPTPGNLGSGLMTRFGTIGESASTNHGLFVQDSWTINNRLTLNLGVRIESENVPNFGDPNGTTAIEFGWGDKISPRLGVAFDVFGDGKTKIFANYGQFYDRFKYELPRGSFGGDFFRRDFFEILPVSQGGLGPFYTNYTRANILGSFTDPLGGECPIATPTGLSRCQFDFRIATNISGADIFEFGAVDPDLKAARQSEWTVGAEHQLGNNFVLAGRFTHKKVDRAVEDVGVVTAEGSEAYIIANPGLGLACEVATDAGLPCAKAERDYKALEVRIDKRATDYFFNASYTWSRLFGNYSGLASSDEVTAGNGRTSPNVNRFFDLPPLGFTADGDPDNGLLATDRTHVFKAWGGYSFDWRGNGVNRTTVSGFTTFQSGTPMTTIYNLYSLGTTILNERGDLGRTEMFTETDLGISHRYKFGQDNRFTLEGYVDIRNLFDEDNVLGVQTNFSNVNFTASALRAGGCTTCGLATDPGAIQEAAVFDTILNGSGIRQFILNFTNDPARPVAQRVVNTYGEPNSFQDPRNVRFGARFFF